METIELCELRGFGTNVNGKVIKCSNDLHNHHILSKGKFMKSKAVKKYVDKHPEVFLAQVCSVHNVQRWADTPAARRILLRKKVELFGNGYVRNVWDSTPWKVFPHELLYDSVMVAPLP